MPILRALEVLGRPERQPAFRLVIESVAETIRSGGTFSDGLSRHPRVFDRLYVNMVKAGEAGGVLDVVLERLAVFLEKAERIKGKVKSAMTYPLIILLVAVGIVGALMIFVIPKFEDIFASMLRGQSLPGLTRAVLGVSQFVQHNVLLTVGLFVLLYGLWLAFKSTAFGGRVLDWSAIHGPGWGDLLLKAAIARFTRTLGTLLAAGVPILPALRITRDTSGNHYVAAALDRVHDRVKEGEGIAQPLAANGVFPGMVTSMIEVGEETGALPEMLTRIADTYDEEVDNAVAALTSVLEPIMIVFMAVVVGTIVIALFLPIIRIIQTLS
jgi:type IV pilus assembly protein PilC